MTWEKVLQKKQKCKQKGKLPFGEGRIFFKKEREWSKENLRSYSNEILGYVSC